MSKVETYLQTLVDHLPAEARIIENELFSSRVMIEYSPHTETWYAEYFSTIPGSNFDCESHHLENALKALVDKVQQVPEASAQ